MGTDEEVFTTVLTQRNRKHLRQVFDEYEKLAGHSFKKAIEEEFTGSAEDAMINIGNLPTLLHTFYCRNIINFDKYSLMIKCSLPPPPKKTYYRE